MLGQGDAMKLLTVGVIQDQESRAKYDKRLKEMQEQMQKHMQEEIQKQMQEEKRVCRFYDFFKESAVDGSSSVPLASSSFKEEVKKNAADKGKSAPFASSLFEEVLQNGVMKPSKPPMVATSPRSAPKSQTQQGSSRRSKFDQMFDQTAANPETPPTAPTTSPKPQTQQESCGRSSPKPRSRKGTGGSTPNPQPRKYTKRSKSENARPATQESFWTICTNCKMWYEYDRIFLNAKLTCPAADCKQFFPAIAIPPPKKTHKRKQESPSRETPESAKFTAPQDVSGSDPVFKVPKPNTPPIFVTTISSVPMYATARPLVINPTTEIPMRERENVEDTFLGQRVADESDTSSERTAARKASEKGKDVVLTTHQGKKGILSFRNYDSSDSRSWRLRRVKWSKREATQLYEMPRMEGFLRFTFTE